MKRLIVFFSYTVILLTLLSVFGWMSIHRMKNDKDFGMLNQPVEFLSGFPDLFSQAVEEVKTLPLTFIPTTSDIKPINALDESLKLLVTYTNEAGGRTIQLMDVQDSTVHHQWSIDQLEYGLEDHNRIKNPFMFEDSSICFGIIGIHKFFRLDKDSKLMWTIDDFEPHHSLEMGPDGNLWTCAIKKLNKEWGVCEYAYNVDWATVSFLDNYIAKINPENGESLYMKSITEILVENGLEYLIIQSPDSEDPIHLNDIEPVLETTPFMQKGDLFLSFRTLQCIIHYRPSTQELIKVITGPFACSHDIDIHNDSTLVIFNNNTQLIMGQHNRKFPDSPDMGSIGQYYSQILYYDMRNESFLPYRDSLMHRHEIFTFTEGLQHFINDSTVFIEEQNSGILWLFEGDELKLRYVLPSHHLGHHHLPNWTRVLD